MKTKSEKITNKLVKESNNTSNKTFTTNYEKSVEDLKNSGVKGNYDKYIDSTTGRPNIGGQNKIDAAKKQSEISSKGAPDDIHNTPYTGEDNIQNEPTGFWDSIKSKYQDVQNKFKKILGINNEPVAETTSVSDVNADIQLQQDLDWVNSINEKMCPECEEIYNAIPTEIPEGLMSNIMGDIPEGFVGDKDLLKMLKDMTKDFLGEQ